MTYPESLKMALTFTRNALNKVILSRRFRFANPLGVMIENFPTNLLLGQVKVVPQWANLLSEHVRTLPIMIH